MAAVGFQTGYSGCTRLSDRLQWLQKAFRQATVAAVGFQTATVAALGFQTGYSGCRRLSDRLQWLQKAFRQLQWLQ